jgi:hypothetical protein
MSKVRLQGHPNSSFTYGGTSYDADEDGFIEVPVGEAVTHAHSHGFKIAAAKPAPRPLAKAAKGGVVDESASNGGDGIDDGDLKKAEEVKPAQKGAKAAKGGAE